MLAACQQKPDGPPDPDPVLIAVAPDAPAEAPAQAVAPARPALAPAPRPVAEPDPLPKEAGRTEGVRNRVVIDGLAVWVESVKYTKIEAKMADGRITSILGLKQANPGANLL